ncbi:29020_t:CDS:2, partial [Gigaspora margarita]
AFGYVVEAKWTFGTTLVLAVWLLGKRLTNLRLFNLAVWEQEMLV